MAELKFFDNLKVHFAGAEQFSYALLQQHAKINYSLWTCYNFLAPKAGLKAVPQIPKIHGINIPSEICKRFKHTIMDSGLFTLMFGAQAGSKSPSFIDKWYHLLCDFVIENKINSTCVEVDCQKVLGVEAAWKYRKKMRQDLPNNRQINVFHLEDGKDGLKRLIDFSDYIAISVPEWRFNRHPVYKEGVYRTACYIKERKPEIDVHLLGCTEAELLRKCRFCTSSDSTSYQSCVRYGSLFGRHISNIKPKALSAQRYTTQSVIDILQKHSGRTFSDNFVRWIQVSFFALTLHKDRYSNIVGSQE